VVDTGLNESKRFLQYLAVALVVAYFGLVKLMYKCVGRDRDRGRGVECRRGGKGQATCAEEPFAATCKPAQWSG
jgi:hypothetical protein